MRTEQVYTQTCKAIEALLNAERTGLRPVKLMVIGGSSSEIAGGVIGHNSTYELGEAVSRAADGGGRQLVGDGGRRDRPQFHL